MDLKEDYENQEALVAKWPKAKREKFRRAVKLHRKIDDLRREMRPFAAELAKVTKSFNTTEGIMADRHAAMEFLNETRGE